MGEIVKVEGATGEVNENGIVTTMIPWYVEDYADVFTVGSTPPLPGLVQKSRSWSDWETIGWRVEVNWEGYSGDPQDLAEQEPVYEFDPSFREEKIQGHPKFADIFELYEGFYGDNDDNREKPLFPETISGARGGLSTGNSEKAPKNPMYGIETYLELGGTFTMTFAREEVPDGILDDIGSITEGVPKFPTPPGQNWLILPPRISSRGNVYEIVERRLLSKPGGWPEGVHKLISSGSTRAGVSTAGAVSALKASDDGGSTVPSENQETSGPGARNNPNASDYFKINGRFPS